jgi:hypothetical protein
VPSGRSGLSRGRKIRETISAGVANGPPRRAIHRDIAHTRSGGGDGRSAIHLMGF